jgi:hypothetical protein
VKCPRLGTSIWSQNPDTWFSQPEVVPISDPGVGKQPSTADRKTVIQTDRQTGRQAGRQADRDRQT